MNKELGLAANVAEAANFATYFTANPPASSTPHLYISALATWSTGSTISQKWREKFPHIPSFTHRKASDIPLMVIQTDAAFTSVAFSTDGTHIVSGSKDKSVRVWDASTGAELKVLNGHTDSVMSTAFSTDGTCIVSGSEDMSVRVWDASTGLKVPNLHTYSPNSVASPTDGTSIILDDESARLSIVGHDYSSWTTIPKNWIISVLGGYRLMWVPQVAYPYSILVISCEGSAIINFRDCKIGRDWTGCYIGS